MSSPGTVFTIERTLSIENGNSSFARLFSTGVCSGVCVDIGLLSRRHDERQPDVTSLSSLARFGDCRGDCCGDWCDNCCGNCCGNCCDNCCDDCCDDCCGDCCGESTFS